MKSYFNEKNKLNHIEEYLCIIAFSVTLCLLFAQVVMRYILRISFPTLEEYSLYLFIWLVFLASSNAFLRNEHLRVEFFTMKLPEKARSILHIGIHVVTIVFAGFVFYYGWLAAWRRFVMETVSATMFPMWILYMCLPVCFGLTIIRCAQGIYYITKHELLGKPEVSE